MMVAMAALQVLVVRFFFQGARKGESSTVGASKAATDEYRLRVNTAHDIDTNIRDMSTTTMKRCSTSPDICRGSQRRVVIVVVSMIAVVAVGLEARYQTSFTGLSERPPCLAF